MPVPGDTKLSDLSSADQATTVCGEINDNVGGASAFTSASTSSIVIEVMHFFFSGATRRPSAR